MFGVIHDTTGHGNDILKDVKFRDLHVLLFCMMSKVRDVPEHESFKNV